MPANLNKQIFKYLCDATPAQQNGEMQESLTCVEAKRKLFNLCLTINHSSRSSKQQQQQLEATDYLIEILDEYLFNRSNSVNSKFMFNKHEICMWIYKRHEQVLAYLFSKLKVSFKQCMHLLVCLCEHLASEKQLRKAYDSKILTTIYASWHMLRDYWTGGGEGGGDLENKTLITSLLTKCNLIELVSSSLQAPIAEMFMQLLVDKRTGLNFKCKLLDLLHLFVDSP